MLNIRFIKNDHLKEKPDWNALGFGKFFTDYMFEMDWTKEKGWVDPRIEPYAPFMVEPAGLVFHYAQETFEGLKAYKSADGRVLLFRPEMNARRFANSNRRLCMPVVAEEDFVQAITELVKVEKDWIPAKEGTSLYIRPVMFADDNGLGVHEAARYKFLIILSPVGAYYASGLKPVKIFVEDELVRAVRGGTGFAKCGANYAISLVGQSKAAKFGYDQVLWLDGVERKYVEEVGAMNVMFLINGEIYTSEAGESVLPGVTRDSAIQIFKDWGYPVHVGKLAVADLMAEAKNNKLEEAFGVGTAAVVSPIGELRYKDQVAVINKGEIGPVSQRLYDDLTGIQWGRVEDKFHWTHEIAKWK